MPRDHRRGESLPVLMDPYGGPHVQRVLSARRLWLESQWLADQGFAVIVCDGRGTPGRGPDWERLVHHDLAATLDDQVDALEAIAQQHPDLDRSRVAIRGWSFGGYLAALAVLRRPDVFHAAVAGAPVTDWALYDTHYTERYPRPSGGASGRLLPQLAARRCRQAVTTAAGHPRPCRRQRRSGALPLTVAAADRERTRTHVPAADRCHAHDATRRSRGELVAASGRVLAGVARGESMTSLVQVLRRHWIFATALILGIALRVLVQVTYWPAMWNSDSHDYFHTAFTSTLDTIRPSGYALFLRIVPAWTSLWPVAVLQHVLALGVAVGIYAVLLRWNVPRWAAALATVPILLDSMQVAIEQYMLSDVLAELMVITACLVLLWRPRISVRQAIAAGLLLGVASTVRTVAEPLVLIAGVWTLIAARRRWRATLALAVAAALPLGAYVVAYHHQHGKYATSSFGAHYLYLRMGLIADCTSLDVPQYEQVLCLRHVPPSQRNASQLLWVKQAPPRQLKPPPGKTVDTVLSDFSRRVLVQQPMRYVRATAKDSLRAFYPTRRVWRDNYFDNQWILTTHFFYEGNTGDSKRVLPGGVPPHVNKTAARVTSHYRLYAPGPLMALCLVVALLAVAGLRNARRHPMMRVAVGALGLICLATIVVPAATTLFCWRYQIVEIALLPVAAAMGLTSILRRPATQDEDLAPEADPVAASPAPQ